MSSTPFRTRKKSSVSSCLCQTNSPFTFTTMTSQLLNWVTVRGDQCSENVASFSDKSILSLIDPSDIVGLSAIVALSLADSIAGPQSDETRRISLRHQGCRAQ